ncbi:MAG TPA: hypothetical protein VH062_10655 [Polyangiaceae bacterium]|jgi:hypothetical protein|nr:hypothetical protein [Polyangiaceae bacterium]
MARPNGITGLSVCLAVAATFGCSSSSKSSGHKPTGNTKVDGGISISVPEGGFFTLDSGKGSSGTAIITPSNPNITINPNGAPPDPIQFTVTGTGNADVEWTVSNPYLGTIDPKTGLFTPNGQVAGGGDIEVMVNGMTVGKVHITINVAAEQNGASGPAEGDAGAGGLGGVGGEGLGGAVADDVLKTLKGSPVADASLKLLYPYDGTVFPLDLLPPLFQWQGGGHGDFDAVYVHLSAPPTYDYKGYFGRPPGLAAGQAFTRSPIPKDVWQAATRSAAGSTLSVELVLAAGGKAYGPLKETYKIALAPFNGRIYYQAYATVFATNSSAGDHVQWDPNTRFGAATLSIDVGAESPKLVAGSSTPDNTGCRVCHSVSAYGDRMVVQHGNEYTQTSTYDLKNGNAESTPYQNGEAGWAGLSPDGNLALTNSVDVTGTNSVTGNTKLINAVTGADVATTGLTDFATKVGLPAFSPDSKHVVFVFVQGQNKAPIGNANKQLVSMDVDMGTKTFSNPTLLWAPANGEKPAFSTFMPTSDAVVFQHRYSGGDNDYSSWHGSHSDLWWVDLATQKATPLNNLNGVGTDGKSYLPTADKNHDQDEHLNYEPSISPVASGGYAWIVFMSRRMYGNVATRDPWEADPREEDIHGDDPTTKKLWMAAIDLNAKPGTDPSHPAFYIPGQEIHGVNSRPFFALQPCVTDRGSCTSGIDCCTGFCRDGLCAPPDTQTCSNVDEKCTTSADCCDTRTRCIGGFCAQFIQ